MSREDEEALYFHDICDIHDTAQIFSYRADTNIFLKRNSQQFLLVFKKVPDVSEMNNNCTIAE